jgi:hypothetical protein
VTAAANGKDSSAYLETPYLFRKSLDMSVIKREAKAVPFADRGRQDGLAQAASADFARGLVK